MNNQAAYSSATVCPVCECCSGAYYVPAGNYHIVKCPDCGLEYTMPNPTDEELNRFYGDYADIRANREIVAINAKRNLDLLKAYGLNEASNILDFGCGNGEFVEMAGDRCFGIELSSRGKGERVLDDIDASPVKRYDFITLWGVLEHLNEPVRTIGRLADRLLPGGHLVITTVDAEGTIPYYYKPPEHLTYWTGKSLERLFERNGFKIRAIQPYEMCQLSDVYLDRLLSRTPKEYRKFIASSYVNLPKIITIPTNEVLVVAELN